MRRDLILVGRFGAPHGVRGEIRLNSFTEDPRAIARYEPLLDASAERRFVITSLRPVKDSLLVVKLRGIETRSAAEVLTDVEIFVPRASLPQPAEEEFYLADLIGLEAVSEAGEALGRIVSVPDYGAGPLLEIGGAEGRDALLLPFTRAIVPVVDLASRRIVVVPPIEVSGEDPDDEGSTSGRPDRG